jgi:hypothetical protein
MLLEINELEVFNTRADLDFFTAYNTVYQDNLLNDDPYYGINLSSNFHNTESLSNLCKSKSSIYLSINIQSLMSKHEQLSMQIVELEQKNISVDIIAIQET